MSQNKYIVPVKCLKFVFSKIIFVYHYACVFPAAGRRVTMFGYPIQEFTPSATADQERVAVSSGSHVKSLQATPKQGLA
jgi:hypothetical protein